jgi:transposase
MREPVFKVYEPRQGMLLPPSYEELVPLNHPVRVVDEVIERIDVSALERTYKGGGTSSYSPRMLLKVLVYGYLRNVYSSRKIEELLKENVHFMWLAGGAKPDHNTISDFRSKRLKGHLRGIFNEVVMLLAESGAVSLKEIKLDGTKIEANANRYTFIWGKSVKRRREQIASQLKEMWAYVEQVYKDEEQQPNTPDFASIDPEAVRRTVEEINEALKNKTVAPKIRQKLAYAKKNYPAKVEQYDAQEKMLAGRNSCSKTDVDATFMRMKEDHLQNGQLKPAYNVQASTNDHYILGYTLTQSAGDTLGLPGHIDEFERGYGQKPESVTADAGYGSEANYDYLEEREITAYVKYALFNKEISDRKHQTNAFHADNLYYNPQNDTYTCPSGQPMTYIGDTERTSVGGHQKQPRMYRAANCRGCPMRGPCHAAEGNRTIQRNVNLIRHRKKIKELLTSEEGIEKRRQRYEVEGVFGNIKQNKGFRRFMLRGLDKVTIETGLIALAHNLKRLSTKRGN